MLPPSDLETFAPKLLLLESSGAVGLVGLGLGRKIIRQATLDRHQRHARDLAPACQSLMQQQAWRFPELDAIAVSFGPGSYTGLRVGLMTGKTLAYALNKPLITIPTFAVLARQALPYLIEQQHLVVIADAQQDRLYVQSWKFQDGNLAEASPLQLEEGEKWRAGLQGKLITGPGLRRQSSLPASIQITPQQLWDPQLKDLLQLGLEQFSRSDFADPLTVEPLYLRPSAAEIQWNAQGR